MYIQKNLTSALLDNVETRSEGGKTKKPEFHENFNIPPYFEPLVQKNYWPSDHLFQFEPKIICIDSEEYQFSPVNNVEMRSGWGKI